MDNLRSAIEVLYSDVNPEDIIQSFYKNMSKGTTAIIDSSIFVNILETKGSVKNKDELKAIHKLIEDKWSKTSINNALYEKSESKVFNIVVYFTQKILLEVGDDPVCDFSQLLRWRAISFLLGEDMFTTAYFANKDQECKRNRHYFSWDITISNNNYFLKEILKKGVADLHFHLYGSSLNFDLSWLSLMNHIGGRQSDFNNITIRKRPEYQLSFSENKFDLYKLCIKACAIRQILFKFIIKEDIEFNKYNKILQSIGDDVIFTYLNWLNIENERLGCLYAKRYDNGIVDYAIRRNLSLSNLNDDSYYNSILYGERWIMYKIYSYIFADRKEVGYVKTLFYVYQIIKTKLRKELIQLNDYNGFANFSEYQDRKDIFIKKNSIYERLLIKLAVKQSLKKPYHKYLEARITPKFRVDKNIKQIRSIDRIVQQQFNLDIDSYKYIHNSQDIKGSTSGLLDTRYNDYYFIYHFIKYESGLSKKYYEHPILGYALPRNYILRKKVKDQALAINRIRCSNSIIKDRIVGIDAAATEIGYRPEIFAHAFRYLKTYSSEHPNFILSDTLMQKLGFTYHVGEDFMDITDGLRAIDEAVKFLNLRSGDRLGHCLALGIDAKEYYKSRSNIVVLTKQDCLDNVMWVLHQIRKFDICISQSLLLELKSQFRKLFYDVYSGVDSDLDAEISPSMYYQSWLLRGDDPEGYRYNNQYGYQPIKPTTYWQRCGINTYSQDKINHHYDDARNNRTICKLFFRYHYDPKVKQVGAKFIEYELFHGYDNLITIIQKKMLFELASLHLCIESNPTSNVLIGGYKRYSKHPLKKFFNLGLTYNQEEINSCPQVSVSINTDDLGVFSTSIDNEYALMAISLEKEIAKGSNDTHSRMIYDWLDRIRMAGMEQRFKRDDEIVDIEN